MTAPSWDEARALAAAQVALATVDVPLRAAVGAVLAADATAPGPLPHYDSAAMDGWAVVGAPPWALGVDAVEVVTGGAVPQRADAIVPIEHAEIRQGRLIAGLPVPGAHIRRAGEEAAAGAVLVAAGTRLSPAHIAVLGIAGLDAVRARRRPSVALVLTGDEVVQHGRPAPGRVRDAFDPLLPIAIERLGGCVARVTRTGDDPSAIATAIDGREDVVVTVGGTGRSRADRLRDALGRDAEAVFDGVAMRPGHPTLLIKRSTPLLALPGNPLAAVAALLSFLPPVFDGLTAATSVALSTAPLAEALPGWRGTSLVPCRSTPRGLVPASATRPNMLRGLAASDVLAVVPPAGLRAADPSRMLPLPW